MRWPVLASGDPALLDRMPVGILVYRYEELLFVNRTVLAWTGYPDLAALRAAGGLEASVPQRGDGRARSSPGGDGRRFSLIARGGERMPVEARLFVIHWDGDSAFATLLFKSAADERIRSLEGAVGQARTLAQELRSSARSGRGRGPGGRSRRRDPVRSRRRQGVPRPWRPHPRRGVVRNPVRAGCPRRYLRRNSPPSPAAAGP